MERSSLRFVLLVGFFCLVSAKVGSKVRCTQDTMRIEIPVSGATKDIYLQQLKDYPDPTCQPKYDALRTLATLELSLKDVYQCGITRVTNKITGKRVYYHTVVIENADPQLRQQRRDSREVLHVKCVVGPAVHYNHTVVRRNVLPAGFQEPEDLEITTSLEEKAPEPVLKVGVRQNGDLVTGELNVSPGTPLQMEISLDKSSAPIYGLLVTHMQVTDTKTQEETIIFNGCSVDPYLFENFNTIDGDFLTAKFRAFKFPESTYVQFRGTVNVCLDKCKGIECSDGQIGYGRRKRAITSLPPDPNKIFEITITSFIKVNYEAESENFEQAIKNQTKPYNSKKLIVGNQMSEQPDNTLSHQPPADRPANLGKAVITEEMQYTAIVADTSSASRHQVTATVLACIALLLRY